MLGIFKSNKDPDRNFNFHKDRTQSLLAKAEDRFDRADQYLCGGGLGNESIKLASAQGSVGKAHSALKEAIFNANEAIKYGRGNQEKAMQIKAVVGAFTSKSGVDMFGHPSIAEAWDKAMSQWKREFDQLL